MRKNKSVQNKLMFIFSADNFSQMLRRFRYMREYSTFQKAQGELLKGKQQEVKAKQNELLAAKAQKEQSLHAVEEKKKSLQGMKENCQTQVNYLNKNIALVQKQIKEYQQKEQALNAEIERIIQAELEAARRAEAERKRKEAEARKKSNGKASTKEEKEERSKTESWKADTGADAKLSSNFTANKGRLPMPITGSYNVVGHYGNYTVSGLRNVTLNNKGIDIRGQQGCTARSIFEGTVSAVFQYAGSYTVMLRHGSYISVYSGLSSVAVKTGQSVSTRTSLGAVGKDADGRYILHFQLRNGSSLLNPELWVR